MSFPDIPSRPWARSLSRRTLLRTAGASAALVTAGSLLAACGDDEDDIPATPAAGTGQTVAATPTDAPATSETPGEAEAEETPGDSSDDAPEPTATTADAIQDSTDRPVLKVGVQDLPDSLDPYLHLSNVGTRVTYSIFDHLLEREFRGGDPPGTGSDILPMIADGWNRIDDLTLEMTLRDDVVFHNGDPLTAEDVKFTFDRMLVDPEEKMLEPSAYVDTIRRVEVVDDYTVRFITAEPDPLLEIRLTSWASWIIPKNYLEEVGDDEFALNPVGTGPYSFVQLRPDEILVLDSNDDYFGGLSPASRVEFQVIPETAGRVAALVSGEVHIITNIAPDQISTLEGNSNVEVRSVPLANCHVLRYNTHHPHMQDKLLRQALSLSIDRELLVEALWGGRAELMRGLQFPEYGDMYNPDRPYSPFDPERARALLEQSSYDGETIEFRTQPAYYTLGSEAAQAIVQMWQQIGVNAEVAVLDNVYSDGVQNIMVTNWSNSSFTADPDGAFWLRWGEPTGTQRAFWTPENPRFNELGEAARKTLDKEFRYAAYQEMLDIWEDEAPGTELYIPVENYGVHTDVDWLPYSFYYMDLRASNLKFE
jgi:peptide/nickel transport system substrate-binding protein